MRPANNVRRPRGRPNRKQHGSPRNQTFDSHGPDVRVRGNATQIYDKYVSLARDATASGNRVAAEGYFQFAEHYFRIINDSTDPRRANPQQNRPDQSRGEPEQLRTDGDQPGPGDSQASGAAEQQPLEMEQPFIDQAQGMWSPRVDGSPNAAASTDSDGEASRDDDADELNGDPAASAKPVSEESSVTPEEEPPAPPRRATRGRPRGRRNSANGAGGASGESTQEAEDSASSKDDSEPEELAT